MVNHLLLEIKNEFLIFQYKGKQALVEYNFCMKNDQNIDVIMKSLKQI
jgi:hypothetical protein